ncbi:hypothetical protein [Bacillus cereus group sp. RP32]|uniref:hypothetical protein n=1 Tax=Bacillus cereus group sp. RP32 TaxID=3040258 RepID=UPI00339AA3EB
MEINYVFGFMYITFGVGLLVASLLAQVWKLTNEDEGTLICDENTFNPTSWGLGTLIAGALLIFLAKPIFVFISILPATYFIHLLLTPQKRKLYVKEIFYIQNPILMYLKNRVFITFY